MTNIFNYYFLTRKEMKCYCKERSAKVKCKFIETGVTPTTLMLKINNNLFKTINCVDIAHAYDLASKHCNHGCNKNET